MRRIHHKFEEEDYYNDGDGYYDEDEDYYAEGEAEMLAQYSYDNREKRDEADSVDEENAAKLVAALPVVAASKVPEKPPMSREEADEMASKVFQISQLVSDAKQQDVKDALKASGGDMDKAVSMLFEQIAENAAKSATPVIVTLEGESSNQNKSEKETNMPPDNMSSAASSKMKPRGAKRPQFVRAEHSQFTSKLDKLPSLKDGESEGKSNLNLVVVGHVDAGKSTMMGHLLYKLRFVSKQQMHKFAKESKEQNKASFAYAWVMDQGDDERQRGVTVDVGVKYFETEHRQITLLDAPGHRDFIPNMITGAAQADVAILVVPAGTGEFERSFERNGQTKEHALLVRYCGVRRLIVAINKMDSCGWSEERFRDLKWKLEEFLAEGGYDPSGLMFVPVSGLEGLNLNERLPEGVADWYRGPSILEGIDGLEPIPRPSDKPLRMVVTDIFKTLTLGAMTVSGKLESGIIMKGENVWVAPSGNIAKVKGIIKHQGNEEVRVSFAKAGENVDVGLQGIEETMIGLSSILCEEGFPIPVVNQFIAEINTFDSLAVPLLHGTQVQVHVQTTQVPGIVSRLISSGEKRSPRFIRKNQQARVQIHVTDTICVEKYDDFRPFSRILLRQNGVTIAAGRVLEIP